MQCTLPQNRVVMIIRLPISRGCLLAVLDCVHAVGKDADYRGTGIGKEWKCTHNIYL